MNLSQLMQKRRTHKIFSGRPVDNLTLSDLIRHALMAPNHRRNEPWRFTVVDYQNINQLIIKLDPLFQQAFPDLEIRAQKKKSVLQRLEKVGGVIYVTCKNDSDAHIQQENYAACCCAIQNMMLKATDLELGSFWATGKIWRLSECLKLMKRNPNEEHFVGSIWFGYPQDHPKAPQYNQESVTFNWN